MHSSQLILLLLAVALIVCVIIIAFLISIIVKLKMPKSMEQEQTQQRPERIIHVAGNYIAEMTINNDIHDNHNCTIHACPTKELAKERGKETDTPYQPPIPKENDYNAVREYIVERKKYDESFRIYWDSHNLKQNCVYLTKELGWIVDDHSLGTNLNRHR